MASKTLAVRYRPTSWEDVTEQSSITVILKEQLATDSIKNAYLFTGPAGTGKTTCARIFANDINKGRGNPIEMDAASNSGVEDVRNIIQQAQTKSLDSEYKCFIIDECHSISNTGWQAFLKLIEEPPAKSIFIFCTTDPQKIPKTILSRVQRYDFQRISQQGIVDRLKTILYQELNIEDGVDFLTKLPIEYNSALEYIAKIADGGMRDAISLMDKALAYNSDLTLENVVTALGTVDYDVMFNITDTVLDNDKLKCLTLIEELYASGKEMKQFLKQYTQFILDVVKLGLDCGWKYVSIPRLETYETRISHLNDTQYIVLDRLLKCLVQLNSSIKYSSMPKSDIQAALILLMEDER